MPRVDGSDPASHGLQFRQQRLRAEGGKGVSALEGDQVLGER
jgi:hypothetical protein